MTAVAPDPKRVPTICICGKRSTCWDVLMNKPMIWLPLDNAYLRICAACKHPATVSADAPINMPRTAGPDRAERKRVGGGYHKREWRVTQ